jgi:hypothetical protein
MYTPFLHGFFSSLFFFLFLCWCLLLSGFFFGGVGFEVGVVAFLGFLVCLFRWFLVLWVFRFLGIVLFLGVLFSN